MTGVVWHIFTFGAIVIFLILIVYRTIAISRLPVHLRWELAPIPHEKGKGKYGGSYLEEYEWWHKPQQRSRIAPITYMAKEILLLKGVLEHNRRLWPYTFGMHLGIYLVVAMFLLEVLNAIFIIAGLPSSVLGFFQGIASAFAIAGYLFGSLGVIGLVLKRVLDANLRPFNTVSTYFRLIFLGAVFISGAYAWFSTPYFISKMSLFIKWLLTVDSSITIAFPLSLHLIISLVFLAYLPLTDMIHFVAKYFTYHAVRWNDEPMDKKMSKELRGLLAQPVSWSATHVEADGKKSWVDVTTEKTSNEKES